MEIIAEIGQNHNGELNLAFELIRKAKENGANVVKFQLYDTKSIYKKENNEWYEYNCKTEITHQQLHLLFRECGKVGIEFMASVFDLERLGWLEEIGVKRYKIASRSIYDADLVQAILKTGKPIIASLGEWKGSNSPVIKASTPVKYLYCISKYPAALSDLNFNRIDFTKYCGFSDHTVGTTATLVALSRGAQIIEKHFTLDKSMLGPDHSCSMTPEDLKKISEFRLELEQCL